MRSEAMPIPEEHLQELTDLERLLGEMERFGKRPGDRSQIANVRGVLQNPALIERLIREGVGVDLKQLLGVAEAEVDPHDTPLRNPAERRSKAPGSVMRSGAP